MLEVADIPAQGSQGAYKYLQLNLPGYDELMLNVLRCHLTY